MIDQIIQNLIKEPLNHMGYDIVLINYNIGKKRSTLQVFLERLDNSLVSIDDCERASHAISLILDTHDPIQGEYNLEVSSPGIDRPLTRMKDFNNYKGYEAKITVGIAMEGRRNFKGILCGTKGEDIVLIYIEDIKKEIGINFYNIQKAKLILTDKLIKDFAKNNENVE